MLNLVDKNKLVVEMTSKARGSEVSLKTEVLNRFSEYSAANKKKTIGVVQSLKYCM